MEKNTYESEHSPESFQHFDMLSSVDLLRYDLQTRGSIHPETWQRVADEELSYVAEGLNRPVATEFTLQEKDGIPVYFHNGQWEPYGRMLEKGLLAAEQARNHDFRKQILVDMAEADLDHFHTFRELKPGERKTWFSEFNDTYHQAYGDEFMYSLGFQPLRRMGFLYEASRDEEGNIVLKTQSVDNSNPLAFAAAMEAAVTGANFDEMLAVYDVVMEEQTGQMHYAGRTAEDRNALDAWQLIRQQTDIVDYFMSEIEKLALNTTMPRHQLEAAKKRLTYGVWSVMSQRAEFPLDRTLQVTYNSGANSQSLRQEIEQSLIRTLLKGERLLGCGGEVKIDFDDLFNLSPSEAFDKIFGSAKGDEESSSWDWKPGICRVTDCPTRPGKTKVGPCSVCRTCQKHFDNGIDPIKLYARTSKQITQKQEYAWAA